MATCRTAHDTIPNFAGHPTISSVRSGAWSDPKTWDRARRPGALDVVQITSGTTVTYDRSDDYAQVIGIHANAVLTFRTDIRTRLTVGTILVLPQGTLQVGTHLAPVNASVMAELVIADQPLDSSNDGLGTYDPMQYGTGLLAMDATVTMHGTPKSSFVRVAAEPQAGDTTLTLTQAPTGWQVGDRLVLPDTRQLADADMDPVRFPALNVRTNIRRLQSQSEVVIIQDISGSTVTLTTPLQFDHSGARDTQGQLDFLPHVGNLTRNILVRSEDAAGTRGHTFFTGTGQVEIHHAAFQHLGRTKAEPLDNTSIDATGAVMHVGTNQIGRYPLHLHHFYGTCPGATPLYTVVGNVVEETGRWGLTVHGTHYGLVQDNIVYDVKGAGIVTEDGSESQNLFLHNLVVRSENNTILTAPVDGGTNTDPLGRKGNGFWFRGHANDVRDNVAADTREGFGWYSGASEVGPTGFHVTVRLPHYPCANTTVAGQYTAQDLFNVPNGLMTNNEAYSTSEFGIAYWFFRQLGPVITQQTMWHARGAALFMQYMNPRFDDIVVRNKGFVGHGINQKNNLDGRAATVQNFDIQGVDTVYTKSGQLALAPAYTWTNGLVSSKHGFVLPNRGQSNQSPGGASIFKFHNVRFLPRTAQPWKSFELPWYLGPGADNDGLVRLFAKFEASV